MTDEPTIPRLVPEEPLPPYTFVPGRRLPHPTSDPAGHLFGAARPSPAEIDLGCWVDCRPYLLGMDLFNHGFYWEAHEAWEPLWTGCRRRGTTADFLKALIKLAAAGVKHLEGRPLGVRSHSCRSAELLRSVFRRLPLSATTFLGLSPPDLIRDADRICREGWPNSPFWLRPELPQGAENQNAQSLS